MVNPTRAAVQVCPDCSEVRDEGVPGYGCPDCGERIVERRCDSCNKFCRRESDNACEECAADLEDAEWYRCSECEEYHEDEQDSTECCDPDAPEAEHGPMVVVPVGELTHIYKAHVPLHDGVRGPVGWVGGCYGGRVKVVGDGRLKIFVRIACKHGVEVTVMRHDVREVGK